VSRNLEKAFEVLDVGAQGTTDGGFAVDHRPDLCARCQGEPPAGDGDLCGGCRAFLLGDGPEPAPASPAHRVLAGGCRGYTSPAHPAGNPRPDCAVCYALGVDPSNHHASFADAVAAFRAVGASAEEAGTAMLRALTALIPDGEA
jgi:hypothetical protein